MQIAISFPAINRKGGVERVAFECARFLAQKNHDVHLIAQETEPLPYENIHLHKVNSPLKPAFLRGKRYFHAATRDLANIPHEALNTHGCVCPLGGIHWVQSVHIAWLERAKSMRSPFSAARFKQLLNPVHPILLKLEALHFRGRNYKKIIATTTQVVDDLHHFYGVPKEDVIIIPNGFNPDEFNPARRAARRDEQRQKLNLSPDHLALLFVANELPRKGYGTLLKSLKILNNPKIRLLVVGRAPIRSVQQWAAQENVAHQVMALGPASDVAAMHAAADLFVLPTQYEAFALAILESLGSGLPVLTTNIPGARDAIQPGKNGHLIQDPLNAEELAAALQPLLNHAALHSLAQSTPQTVTQYQWPTVLQRYEKLLIDSAAAPRLVTLGIEH